MMAKIIAICIIALTLFGCLESGEPLIVETKDSTFEIPAKRLFIKKSIFPGYKGDEYSPPILKWTGKEIKEKIPDYPIADDEELTGHVYFNYTFDEPFLLRAYFFDQEFDGGESEYDEELGLYKVYNKLYLDSKRKFTLTRKKPSNRNKLPNSIFDVHVGTCLYLLSQKKFSCHVYVEIAKKEHAMWVRTGGLSSLKYLDKFSEYVKTDIMSYKVKPGY